MKQISRSALTELANNLEIMIDLLNEANELLLRVSISKLFQSLTVAGKKDESNVARRVDGVIKSFWFLRLYELELPTYSWRSSERYDGTQSLTALCMIHSRLRFLRLASGSQPVSKYKERLELYSGIPVTTLAAASWTFSKRSASVSLQPVHTSHVYFKSGRM